MQKKITVSCPKCQSKNRIVPPSSQGGQISCQDCYHQFKVVPRSKTPTSHTAILTAKSGNPHSAPAFNSLLNQSVNQPDIPQRNTLKSKQPVNKSVKTNTDLSKMINNMTGNTTQEPLQSSSHAMIPADQKNSGIDADTMTNLNNLVFTLLPNAETQKQADVPLLLNDAIEKTDAIHAKTQYLHDQQDKLSKEFNWTLASLVALTVLMMQLFYLMAVK